MSQHISRKELKKDEIRETLAHGAEAVFSHQRLLWTIGGTALLVALAVVGWRFYSQRQTVKASGELEEAMKVFQARIRTPGEPSDPNELTYIDERNKYEDAAKKFSAVGDRYSRTRPGQVARYYAALSLERLGRDAEAEKLLKELENSSHEEYAALARFRLAGIFERTGRGGEAVKLYRQLANKPTALVPKSMVLLALADHLRKTNPQEATQLYKQIKKDFPDSAVADEADKRLEMSVPTT